jgi:hypothetical protein
MKRYSLKEFIDIVERADIVYGQVTLNAADRIPARIKKKMILESLKSIKKPSLYQEEIGYYGDFVIDHKGRKILKVL